MNKASIFAGPTPSFVESVAAPSSEPDAAPLVCLSFNADWLPYVIGGLMQLAQRTTWSGDASTVQDALDRVQLLMSIFGTAEVCAMVSWRFTVDCVLQFSEDGGSTWTDTPGWDTFAPTCFAGPPGDTGPIGPPGLVATPPTNPQDAPVAQQACNIAAYLANHVLKSSVQTVYDQVVAANSLFNIVELLIPTIFAGDFVAGLIVAAGAALYNIIQASTLSDFSSALADDDLWLSIACAIYTAIGSVGYVTDGNYAALRAGVDAVAFAHSDVHDAVLAYLDGLGAAGLEGLQNIGSTYVGDCSACPPLPAGGCLAMTAAIIGTNTAYSTGVLNPGKFNVIDGSLLYAGVTGPEPDQTRSFSLFATPKPGTYIAIGFYSSAGTNGLPNAGNNLWINDIDAALTLSAGTWQASAFGVPSASGSSSGTVMELHYDAGTNDFTVRIDGADLYVIGAGPSSYKPVIYGVNNGDEATGVRLCYN